MKIILKESPLKDKKPSALSALLGGFCCKKITKRKYI